MTEGTTEEITKAKVLTTMMNGKVVHEEAVDWDSPETLIEFGVCK